MHGAGGVVHAVASAVSICDSVVIVLCAVAVAVTKAVDRRVKALSGATSLLTV